MSREKRVRGYRVDLVEALEQRLFMSADLTGTIGELPSANLTLGAARIPVTVTLHNAGDAPAKGLILVNLFARPAVNVDSTGDVPLGSNKVSLNLPATKNSNSIFNFAVPLNMAGGNYKLVAVIDPTGKITENDETNNTVVSGSNFTVTPLDFNLQSSLDSIKLPTSIVQGFPAKGTAKVTVSRTGSAATPNAKVNVAVYARLDGGGDTLVGVMLNQTLTGLTNAKGKSFTVNVVIPPGLAAGTYHFYSVVDPATDAAPRGNVTETNDTNADNSSVISAFSLVSAPASRDLTISAFSSTVGLSVSSATKPTATITVTNSGNSDTAATSKGDIKIYATTNGIITGNSPVIGKLTNQLLGIKAGGTKKFTLTLDLSALTASNFTFVARVEPTSGITQSDSSNDAKPLPTSTTVSLAPGVLGDYGDVVSLVKNQSGTAVSGYSESGVLTTNRGFQGIYTYSITNGFIKIYLLSFTIFANGGPRPTIVLRLVAGQPQTVAGKTLTFSKTAGSVSWTGVVPDVSFAQTAGKFSIA